MNLFVLSERYPDNTFVGMAVRHTLEEVLASTCDATFIVPQANNKIKFLKRYRQRLQRSWYSIDGLPTLGPGPNILLAVGLGPSFLLSMFVLDPLLHRFDLRIGYLLDGFNPQYLDRAVIPHLDHLFVITAEIADRINQQTVPTQFLPLATNALDRGCNRAHRCIDIVSYGRRNQDLHRCLQVYYNQTNSERIYHHSTFLRPQVEDLGEHITLLSKFLDRSKVSLCFEASYLERFQGYSPILLRWFEGWASGCNIVGRRPLGQGVAELIDWENSTLELPENPADWIFFFEEILSDKSTLTRNSQRNYQECLLRHDWRYRVSDLLKTLELPIPENLKFGLTKLKQKLDETTL